jgi:hypothetical protein
VTPQGHPNRLFGETPAELVCERIVLRAWLYRLCLKIGCKGGLYLGIADRNLALLVSFPQDHDAAAAEIDGLDEEMGKLRYPHSRREHQLKESYVAKGAGCPAGLGGRIEFLVNLREQALKRGQAHRSG